MTKSSTKSLNLITLPERQRIGEAITPIVTNFIKFEIELHEFLKTDRIRVIIYYKLN